MQLRRSSSVFPPQREKEREKMRKIDSADRERARARDTVRERERVGAREKERVRVREREREREGGGVEGGEKALPCGQVTVTLTQQQIHKLWVSSLWDCFHSIVFAKVTANVWYKLLLKTETQSRTWAGSLSLAS